MALAHALQMPFDIKRLVYRRHDFLPGLFRLPSLAGIDISRSSSLLPPWPDLLISAGMRNEPISLWIKKQSPNTRIVHIGRTWANTKYFDLVVTTPQYRLPSKRNILHNTITMHDVRNIDRNVTERIRRKYFPDLDPPYIAIMIGGNSGPYTFCRKTAERLATTLNTLSDIKEYSLLITTSARTPVNAIDTIENRLLVPKYVYRWRPDDPDNPYHTFLALAQKIIVTCDSVSMLSEAVATGKPVYLFDTESRFCNFSIRAFMYKGLMRFGPDRLSRDLSLVHQKLVHNGHVAWINKNGLLPFSPPPPPDDVDTTARIIRERLLSI